MKPPGPFRAKTNFRCSGVVIIDALAASDLQTARRLFDDLTHLRDEDGASYVQYFKATTKAELVSILAAIRSAALCGFKPILHFEAHGSKGIGLHIGAGHESISWQELGERLREINIASRNGVGIVMAACFGFEQLEAIDILKPCPYNFLIGPPEEVQSGFIDDRMSLVYRELFASRSLERAIALLNDKFVRFQAELFFCTVFVRYLRNNCTGSNAARRVEALLSRAIGEGLAPDRQRRRELRKTFKTLIRKPEADYYRMSRRFLHGKRTVQYEEVLAFANRLDA